MAAGRHRRPTDPWWWPWAAILSILASTTIAVTLGVLVAWAVYARTH